MADRAVSYIRVSTARDEMVSPEIQRAANGAYATSRGYQIIEEISDLDLTGRFWKRRAAERAVTMVESHQAEVIIVWKWSRFARNRRDWAIALDRVESIGGRLESSTEPIDVSTSNGRFARGVMAELAIFESERIGDTWREVKERRVSHGLPGDGGPRWGYTYTRDGGYVPDPLTAPVLAEMYRRYIAGDSNKALVRWLNDTGQRGGRGGLWFPTGVYRVLDSGFGAGLVRHHGQLHPGSHRAVITPDEWELYLAARRRRSAHRRSEASSYLLSGLLRCMYRLDGEPCGSTMGGTRLYYRCIRSNNHGRHPSDQVYGPRVERGVLAWLAGQADELNDRASRMSRRVQVAEASQAELRTVAARVVALDRQLTALTVHLASGLVPEAAYSAARDTILHEKEGLEARQVELASRSHAPLPVVPDLLRDWDIMPVARRRELLRRLIARVEVTPGRSGCSIRVIPIWES